MFFRKRQRLRFFTFDILSTLGFSYVIIFLSEFMCESRNRIRASSRGNNKKKSERKVACEEQ